MNGELPARSLFRAYDVRGVAGRELNEAAAEAIGWSLGSEARARGFSRLAVGCDGRLSSPALMAAAIRGLRRAGLRLLDVGLVPTPLLYFAAVERGEGCGLMVTGSHNPPEYNGLKMMLGGEALAGEEIAALRDRLARNDLAVGSGEAEPLAVADAYFGRLLGGLSLARPMRVVVDCGNGAAGPFAPRLLRALGCEVVELFSEVDGRFPHHHPDPSQPGNMADLIEAVRDSGAEVGLAFDGDGDRLGVVTAEGEIVWPDRLLILFAREILARHPGAGVVSDIKCSGRVARAVEEAGGRHTLWRSGHSLVRRRMRESGALLGGELTGHLFFADRWYGFDDALYAAARLLAILAASPPEALVLAALPRGCVTPELRIPLSEGVAEELMERLAGRRDALGGRQVAIDGLRVDYDDGWGLVRASHTLPSLVLRFEGDSPAALEAVQSRFRNILLDLEPALKLPF